MTPAPPTASVRGRRELGLGIALVVVGVSIGVAAGPASSALAHLAPDKAFWTASRLTAFLAYLAFAGSVAYGLGMSSGLIDALVGRPVSLALHRDLALAGVALAVAHMLLLLGDGYIGFTITSLLVPGASPYRAVQVAVGQIALWAAVATSASYYARAWMGVRLWRGLHSLSVVVFMLATAHGLYAGSDSRLDVVWWLYVALALLVLFLFVYRLATAGGASDRPARPGL